MNESVTARFAWFLCCRFRESTLGPEPQLVPGMNRLFSKLRIRPKVLLNFLAISLVSSLLYTLFSYTVHRREILEGIDRKLQATAHAMPHMLPPA